MSETREYTTAPKTEPGAEEGSDGGAPPVFSFTLDGVPMTARKPKDALVAQLAPVQSRRTPPGMKVKLALDFIGDCVEEPGRTVLETRLLDPADALDAGDVIPILTDMADFWRAHERERRSTGRR